MPREVKKLTECRGTGDAAEVGPPCAVTISGGSSPSGADVGVRRPVEEAVGRLARRSPAS